MAIANTLGNFLIENDIDYHVFPHDYAETASESANAAHLPPGRIAKAVVLATPVRGHREYQLAVLPATHDIDIHELKRWLNNRIELAKEHELGVLFPDCAIGAVPILGEAYGLPVVVDDSLKNRSDDIFFEAGDHEELIRVSADQFYRLMAEAEFADFSQQALKYHHLH